MIEFVRRPAVLRKRGRCSSQHYDDIRRGLFTPPVKLGSSAAGWPEHEVEVLNAARLAGKTDDEIRTLVRELVARRADALTRALAAVQLASVHETKPATHDVRRESRKRSARKATATA